MTPVSVHVEINKISCVSPYCNNVGIIPHYTCGDIAFIEQDCPLCLEVDTVIEAEGDPSLKANVM